MEIRICTSSHAFVYIRLNGFKVSAGTETSVIVSTNVLYSTDAVKAIDISKRKCRFRDEPLQNANGSRLMDVYSQTGCVFQCHLEIAIRFCGCVPWYYPTAPGMTSA